MSKGQHSAAASPAIAAVVVACALLSPARAAEDVKAIGFLSFTQATRLAAANERVTVVYFTADWCGWCRKMQSTTFRDSAVVALATRFNWAKVDIDEAPDLAARFGVQAVPAVVLLSDRGLMLDQRAGFLSPDVIVAWLEAVADDPDAPGQAGPEAQVTLVEIGTGKAAEDAVVRIVGALAQGDRADRDQPRQHVVDAGKRAWPGLVKCLAHQRLAVRAAANDILIESTDAGLRFDPFAPAEQRREQLEAWRRWLAQQHPDIPPARTFDKPQPDQQ